MRDFESRNEERRRRWEEKRHRWEARMERHAYYDQANRHSHIWTGLFLVVIGGLSLAKSFGTPFPVWLFTWQMLLIAIGLFIGFRRNFAGGWFVPVLIGGAFLLNDYFLEGNLRHHMWPLILILIGVLFMLRPRRNRWRGGHWYQEKKNGPAGTAGVNSNINSGDTANAANTTPNAGNVNTGNSNTTWDEATYSEDDFVDTTSIFGGTKKVILSKNFVGGDMVNIFGGSEIDLTKADMKDTAVLEVTAIFGGATLIVPSNWAVKSEAVTIFGGISDKRSIAGFSENSGKNLLIKGTVLFGGIEIKSY